MAAPMLSHDDDISNENASIIRTSRQNFKAAPSLRELSELRIKWAHLIIRAVSLSLDVSRGCREAV